MNIEKSLLILPKLGETKSSNGLLKKVIVNDWEISTPLELNREI